MDLDYLDSPVHLLHIGASTGQELENYLKRWSKTLKSITFIECIPSVFEKLQAHVARVQRGSLAQGVDIFCVKALTSDEGGQTVPFYLSNNEMMSSSMHEPDMKLMGETWSFLQFTGRMELVTTTVDALVSEGKLRTGGYDTLILDVQGSELKVLKGMPNTLKWVQQMVCEFSLRPFYKGGVLLDELVGFLKGAGIAPIYIPQKVHGDMVCKRFATGGGAA